MEKYKLLAMCINPFGDMLIGDYAYYRTQGNNYYVDVKRDGEQDVIKLDEGTFYQYFRKVAEAQAAMPIGMDVGMNAAQPLLRDPVAEERAKAFDINKDVFDIEKLADAIEGSVSSSMMKNGGKW